MASKKRLLTSTLIGFLMLAGSLGAFGLAAADDTPDGLSGTWSVPPQRVGDRAVYERAIVEDRGLGGRVIEAPEVHFGFQWLPSDEILDAEGDIHATHVLLESHPRNREANIVSDVARYLDQGDRSLAAYTYDSSLPWLDVDGVWQDGDAGNYHRQVNTVAGDDLFVTECHGRPQWAGRSFDLGRSVALWPACSRGIYWAQDDRFVAAGIEDGLLHMVSWRGGFGEKHQVMHAWLSPDHPYPVRVAFQSGDDPGRFVVDQMTSFRRGDGAALAWGEGDVRPLPDAVFAPRAFHGPSEAGIDHPFPLSQALDMARDDVQAAPWHEYQSAHPQATVVRADYRPPAEGALAHHQWYIEVADEREAFAFYYGIEEERGVLGLGELIRRTTFQVVEPTNERLWPAGTSPAQLPTVASMWERWTALASGPFQEAPNTWGITMWCGHDPCQRPVVSVVAGFARGGDSPERSVIEWRDSGDGGEWAMSESMARGAPQSAGHGDQVAQDPPVVTALSLGAGLWKFPTSQGALAGAGLLALLAAGTYYAWPFVKTGAAGLFSRVHDPDALLQHPVRAGMRDLIEAEPGIHVRALRHRLELGRGAADHHLRKLEGLGLVQRVHEEGYACLFLRGQHDRRIMHAAPVLKAQGARHLLDAVARQAGSTGAQVSRATGLTAGTVTYHMKRLERAGLLDIERTGRQVRMSVTHMGREIVARAAQT